VTTFNPGVNHGHSPSGKWSAVQSAPNSSTDLNVLCKIMTPEELVGTAMFAEFRTKPIALVHLNWYLTVGRGRDFNEDANITTMLTTDGRVQALIRSLLPATPTKGVVKTFTKVEQSDYTNQDLRFAFGAIDRLDIEFDFDAGTLHAWFQDRYEWHPCYPGLYSSFSDDKPRETNCLHAALVEMKLSGAADFWMKGEATVPLTNVTVRGASSGVTSDW
jgi:hypothetical protein